MIAVILAAGIGSRLRPITDSVPKCLVQVDGIPILKYQLDAYKMAGVGKIIVVTGYLSHKVRDYVSSISEEFSDVCFVENLDYSQTNNMYSLWLARNWIDDDLLLSNGDVIFDHKIIRNICEAETDNYIAVDSGNYLEESMKVAVLNGRITEISKKIPPDEAYATSIDLYRLNKKAADTLFAIIDRDYIAANKLDQWTEVALQDLFIHEIVKPFDIQGKRWIEIDTPSDLQEAERLFGKAVHE